MTDFQLPLTAVSESFVADVDHPQQADITLYPHQVDVAKWMLEQEMHPPIIHGRIVAGGLIGDTMGLGKTKSTISVMTINRLNRTLVVCPKSVFYQWARELIAQGHTVYSMHPDYASLITIAMDGSVVISKERVLHAPLPTVIPFTGKIPIATPTIPIGTLMVPPTITPGIPVIKPLITPPIIRPMTPPTIVMTPQHPQTPLIPKFVGVTRPVLPPSFVGLTTFGMVRPFPEPPHKLETASSVMAVLQEESPSQLIPYNSIIWDRLVCDEVHNLRNGFSLSGDASAGLRKKNLRYYRMLRLRTAKDAPKWGLTGTPLQNRIGDVASIFMWIGLAISKMTKLPTLQEYIQLKMFRRTGANLTDLTKALIMYPTEKYTETKITVEYSTKKERDFYLAAAGELGERIAEVLNGGYEKVESEDNMLVLLNMLRFLSAHPSMYIEIHNKRYLTNMPLWDGPLSKYDMIQEQLLGYFNDSESCIIFVHFYEEARQIADRAEHIGYTNIEFMNGSVSMEDRDWIVQSSKQKIANGEPVLIVANVIACGEGINLQHFCKVIIATPDWNPAAEEQAIARVDRIGQTRKVEVTRYYHEAIEKLGGTLNIDEYMKQKQEDKTKLAEELINATPNAAWTFGSTSIPGYPDMASTVFPDAGHRLGYPVVTDNGDDYGDDVGLTDTKPLTAKGEIQRRMRVNKANRTPTTKVGNFGGTIIPVTGYAHPHHQIPPVPPTVNGLGVKPITPPQFNTNRPVPHPIKPPQPVYKIPMTRVPPAIPINTPQTNVNYTPVPINIPKQMTPPMARPQVMITTKGNIIPIQMQIPKPKPTTPVPIQKPTTPTMIFPAPIVYPTHRTIPVPPMVIVTPVTLPTTREGKATLLANAFTHRK
jgi:superfamily II DNA or RNA helicase